MSGKRKRKVRVAFSKNRTKRTRSQDLTRRALRDIESVEDLTTEERVSGKGDLTRRRTVIASGDSTADTDQPVIDVDETECRRGRVLYVIGANRCRVRMDETGEIDCTVRRRVRTMARDARNAVVAGDRVTLRIVDDGSGVIERVESRTTALSRVSGRREHVIAANVDLAVIVVSAADPPLKPGLIDRFIVSAEQGDLEPVVCINKVDLDDPVRLQPIVGTYARLGYHVVLASAATRRGLSRLKQILCGRQAVLTGQSGVGKTSLLNALQPELRRRTREVSADSGKGRHTTRVAEMIPLATGGAVVDTPGIRQLELWDVEAGEVEAYFREFRPFVARCRYPSCLHLHETECAVRDAVRDGSISVSRYTSYVRIIGDEDGATGE